MHAFTVLHVQQYIYVGRPGSGRVMWDTIILWCLWANGKMQKYNHILQNRAHQNFFFSDTVSFWTVNSLRWIPLISNGKLLEHESKAGLFPGSVFLGHSRVATECWDFWSPWYGCQVKKLEDFKHPVIRTLLFWDSLLGSSWPCQISLVACRGDLKTEKVKALWWSQVIPQASLAPRLEVDLQPSAVLSGRPLGEGGSPSGPASSSLVAGSYCRVCFAEKINQF